MTEVGQVDADLMRPPGAELGFDECHRPQPLERAEDRDGCTPAASRREGGPPRSGPGAADAAIYPPLAGQVAPHEGYIPPVDAVGAKLPLEMLRGLMGQRQHEHPRGLAVETVNYEDAPVAPRAPLDLGSRAAHNGVILRIGRGVDEQASGLVDH